MRLNGVRTGWARAATFTVVLAALTRPVYAGPEADFQKLLADQAPAIVTVKFVLKVKSTWGDSDNESEATGVMIEPDGLLLCSNTTLSGYQTWLRRSGSTATPTDIKVLIGDDSEGLDAKLIARDSELDLAWLRIENPAGKKFAFIDLKASAVPTIGQRHYSVIRLGKFFDRVPVVSEGRIGGVTTKPRRLYVPSSGGGGFGLPCFNAGGDVIGVFVSQMPDPREMEGAGSSLGGFTMVILPAAEVVKATRRAREVEDEDKQGDDRPADTDGQSGD